MPIKKPTFTQSGPCSNYLTIISAAPLSKPYWTGSFASPGCPGFACSMSQFLTNLPEIKYKCNGITINYCYIGVKYLNNIAEKRVATKAWATLDQFHL
jgi:hypothetical protein